MSELTAEELQDYVNEFVAMCQQRHEMGAEKYGPVNFLRVDSLQMAIEEVVDLANYAMYTFIKLRILQGKWQASAGGDDVTIVLGRQGFIGKGNS